MRDIVFLSHARPEDDEFTRWLALQLIREGYPVWCDLIKLKGGEDFWKDIQAAIEARTTKFLYVITRTSNDRDGPLMELAAARAIQKREKIKDFVIPLALDDLPPNEYAIELKRLNAVKFNDGWAKGFATLLEKLEQDGVRKDAAYGAEAVATWWRDQFSADRGVLDKGEYLLSSWFPIESLPEFIYQHLLFTPPFGSKFQEKEPGVPYQLLKTGILSFAPREDFAELLIKDKFVADTFRFKTQDILDGKLAREFIEAKDARNVVIHLLSEGWNKMATGRGLSSYEMANSVMSHYFVGDQVKNDRINFTGVDGQPTYKYVMGYKRVGPKGENQRYRHWHYAVSAKPLLYPVKGFSLRGHVLFSDDAINIWDSAEKIHKARMSQCKNWWNADWRDRMLATMSWLASEDNAITVPLGSDAAVKVGLSPVVFESPFSYVEPGEDREVSEEEPDDGGDGELDIDDEEDD
ncbi:MAG TPA: toll/interleukin-1 receptor domain-containing protein [Pyrinomonadaceae bacterium]|jgi:hypothetical protein